MLLLLRNIRHKLLTGNKVTTYLLYAIGEISLVVVGILIAVQLDNWNESNHRRESEVVYLRNLKKDLQTDLDQLINLIDVAKNKVQASMALNEMAKKGDDKVDLLLFSNHVQTILWTSEFSPNQNTFSEMINSGNLSIIKNDTISSALLQLNKEFAGLLFGHEHIRREYHTYLFDEFVNTVSWRRYYQINHLHENLELVTDTTFLTTNNAEMKLEARNILSNKRFQNGLFFYEMNNLYMQPMYQAAETNILRLIELIDSEINRKQ